MFMYSLCAIGTPPHRLVSYELLYECPSNRKDRMKVIISSQFLYFFRDSPPDPKTLDSRVPLDELAECRPAKGKSSECLIQRNSGWLL